MIHIENINNTVNAQALSDEAETSHTLDAELLKAMVDSLSTKDEDAEEAKDAEPENQEEVQPPINAARMDSLQQQSEALQLAHALSGGKLIDDSTKWADTLHAAAAELCHLQARNEQLEKSESDLIAERDYRDEIIDRMSNAVLGTDRAEWSSSYNFMDAVKEIEDHIAELEAQLSAIGAGGVERRPIMTINKPEPEPEVVAWRWRKPVVNDQGETVGETAWELRDTPGFLPWWTNDPLIRLSDYERLQAECEKLCKQAAVPETREALGKRLIADVKVANAIAAVACQRVAELPDRDEQCLEMQQALHEEEDEEEDDSEYDCPHCGGTGEGQYDDQTCSVCRGKGVCPK